VPVRALLLDFGGVLVDAPADPAVPTQLTDHLRGLVGDRLTPARIARDLTDGDRRYARWRDEVSAEGRPVELAHQEVWDRFVTAAWPPDLQNTVRERATALSYAWARDPQWTIRPGIPELLDAAAAADLPTVVVSNTICGAAHRDFLDEVGLTDRFAAQLYSDEVGVRKPNPDIAWRAANEVGVDIGDCWFIGDSRNRDIACARRAGVGFAVLMRSARTAREADASGVAPDATVDDGCGALALLRKVVDG
jgi:FMN phosphatase YigB (HAD superfamily)